jgi:hypothetical protein
VCGSDGYREWANKGLEVGVEMSLERDEPILILCFEVATAVWLRIPVLLDVAISSHLRLGRLEGPCRPHLQGTCT